MWWWPSALLLGPVLVTQVVAGEVGDLFLGGSLRQGVVAPRLRRGVAGGLLDRLSGHDGFAAGLLRGLRRQLRLALGGQSGRNTVGRVGDGKPPVLEEGVPLLAVER